MRLGATLQFGRLTVQVDAFIVLCIFLSCGMFISLGFWPVSYTHLTLPTIYSV